MNNPFTSMKSMTDGDIDFMIVLKLPQKWLKMLRRALKSYKKQSLTLFLMTKL